MKYQLVKLKSNRGNRKQSIDALMQIAEQFEADSKKEKAGAVYADIAMLCSEHGEYEEAWAYAERARLTLSDLHPAMGIVHQVLASVFLDRCDDEKAEKHLCNAINIFEQHGKVSELEETQLLMCQHLINQGRHSEAFRQMEAFHIFIKRRLEQRGIVL
ncbi:hypothetical protein [Tumebacillus lipolyticus]|uniref:Tetratricopeptide repeat protein n=1 Tax=Tumebacillus lipolyticus TaxID=1280370 RepID=A0ABW4ZZH0_9BACL